MSLRTLLGPLRGHRTFQAPSILIARSFYSTDVPKPLRILFCGSDEFSCESLRAVAEEKKRNPGLIASIDVLCRPGKLSGRGMKTIREGKLLQHSNVAIAYYLVVPIKRVAEELGLPVHERDTFTGWKVIRLASIFIFNMLMSSSCL
jgi:methionyl-tRNA formyltransferase